MTLPLHKDTLRIQSDVWALELDGLPHVAQKVLYCSFLRDSFSLLPKPHLCHCAKGLLTVPGFQSAADDLAPTR